MKKKKKGRKREYIVSIIPPLFKELLMKSNKKIHIMNTAKCVIPIGLPYVEELVSGTKLKPDRLKLILHQFYVSYIFNELGDKTNYFHKDGWVTLDANRLKKLCKHYNAYLNLLEQKGIIEVKRNPITGNKSYVRNKRACAYRILPKYLRPQNNRRFRIETITDYTTVKSITKDKIQYSKNVVKNKNIAVSSSHKILYEMMNDVGVDTDALDALLSTLKPQDLKRKRNSLEGIYDARILVDLMINSDDEDLPMPTVDTFGERLHSIFTRMPSEFRKFFYVKSTGEPFKTIDICNSQAYMLALIISHPEKLKKLLPEFEPLLIKLEKMKSDEHKYFFHLCKEGKIYDHWAGLRGITRNEAKDEIIKRILFSKPIT
jgi:hypothetical protein